MNYQMTLYIADRKVNKFMETFDLKPKHKVYVSFRKANFETSTLIDEKYFLNIIEKSREQEDFWIPAIEFCGNLFHAEEIKEVSDGKRIMFLK